MVDEVLRFKPKWAQTISEHRLCKHARAVWRIQLNKKRAGSSTQ